MIRIIKANEFITTNWSGGETTQLFIYPQGSNYKENDFQFRISSATVELEKSEFTKLNGVNRYITPLDGELQLTHDGEKFINLKAYQIYNFSGEIATTSYGKVRDFNLMLRDNIHGKLETIDIEDEMSIPIVKDGFDIFYSHGGYFKFIINDHDYELDPGELLLVNTCKFTEAINIKISTRGENKILRSSISF